MLTLLFSMALAAGAPEATPPTQLVPAPAATPMQGSLALGVEIATLLNNAESTRRQTTKVFDETMPAVLADDPNVAALEVEFPGITQRMLDAMQSEVETQVVAGLPDLWNRLGTIYAGSLTDAEMRELLIFYRSPTGQWLIDGIVTGADFSKWLGTVMTNPDVEITAGDLRSAVQGGHVQAGLVRTMTAEREADLRKLFATSAGRKVLALNPKLLEVGAAWSNESTPEEDARIDAIVDGVIAEFIDAPEDKSSRQGSK